MHGFEFVQQMGMFPDGAILVVENSFSSAILCYHIAEELYMSLFRLRGQFNSTVLQLKYCNQTMDSLAYIQHYSRACGCYLPHHFRYCKIDVSKFSMLVNEVPCK